MKPNRPFPIPSTDPADIYRVRDALYSVDMLIVGIVHLDIFTRLADGPLELEGVCKALGTTPRPTDVMLTLFAAMGLLEKPDGRFAITALAREHLVKGSPWDLGPYFASFKDRPICQGFLEVLKTGKPVGWGGKKEEKDWTHAMEDPAFAEPFTAAMDCRGAYLAPSMAKAFNFKRSARLLDVAGGSGIYACAVAAQHQHMRASVLEKPPVDRVATAMIEKRGFGERVTVIAGDMFSAPLPGGHDVHLFSNVLHDWDEPDVRKLIKKSHDALLPGGAIVIHDAHLNREKTGPLPVAEYSVLLAHSCEGRCYSEAEMEEYLKTAGFTSVQHTPTAANRSLMTATKAT
jgi:2-polyprenyl-3-methyl-5-hydroxy-6-metoxy-1,4-benzoquinol methylase